MNTRKILLNADFDVRYETCQQGCSIPLLTYHDLYEIYLLEEGERTTVIDDKLFATVQNDAAMFPSRAFHRSYGSQPYKGICFHFSESYINTYYSPLAKAQMLQCFSHSIISLDSDSMEEIKKIAKKMNSNKAWNFSCLAGLMEIMNYNIGRCANQIKQPVNTSAMCLSPKISAVMSYVNENFVTIKNFTEICELLHISEGYLCRGFKKQTGMTLSHYINTLKIQYACRFLSDSYSPRTVCYIANECGFETTSYFTRIFKKIMGCTPTKYRDSLKRPLT